LAALNLRACVKQPFDCSIIQNHQVVQSMKRLMDWTLEDNMVDGLFLCATLTGRREDHYRYEHAATEMSDTGVEVGKMDAGCS